MYHVLSPPCPSFAVSYHWYRSFLSPHPFILKYHLWNISSSHPHRTGAFPDAPGYGTNSTHRALPRQDLALNMVVVFWKAPMESNSFSYPQFSPIWNIRNNPIHKSKWINNDSNNSSKNGISSVHVLKTKFPLQAYFILLHFTLLCFTDVAFFINLRQDRPSAKDYNSLFSVV